MNPTQKPGNNSSETRPTGKQTPVYDLADILSDGGRFRTLLSRALA